MRFYKYQGAGNDFLIADNRDGSMQLSAERIAELCDRRYGVGADGLMLLEKCEGYDFRMVYYNSDGSGGMMCGNGGRCIVAFAADLGMKNFRFVAADGEHEARILSEDGRMKTVSLKMADVPEVISYDALKGVSVPSDGFYLFTGTHHYVRFVEDLDHLDVEGEGRDIRYNAQEFRGHGVNVNFVEPYDGGLKVRTYEKGVEAETFACGTGIVASSFAAFHKGIMCSEKGAANNLKYEVKAKRDALAVEFTPEGGNVWLTGPATYVAEINV